MRVTIVTPEPADGPMSNLRALREYRALAEAGHEPELLSVTLADAAPRGFLGRVQYFRAWTAALTSGILGGTPGPDLIIAHDMYTLAAGARAARKLGVPLVYDAHEWWPKLISNNSRAEALAAEVIERWYLRDVEHILTINETIAARFRRLGKPTTVLYNSRSLDEIPPSPEDARNTLGYSRDDFVMGFVGNLHELERGGMAHELFRAMALQLPVGVKALVVGGPQNVAEKLRWRAEECWGLGDRVRVVDTVPYGELAPYYGALDLGLVLLARLPNYDNALGWKFFDYMGRGIPVLVPDFPDMAHIVRDVKCGWVYPDGGLSETLRKITFGPPEHRQFGWYGRRAFELMYSWDVQKADFVRVAEGLCK